MKNKKLFMLCSQLIQGQWKWGNRNWASCSLGVQLSMSNFLFDLKTAR